MLDNRLIHLDSGDGSAHCGAPQKHLLLNTDSFNKWRGNYPIRGVVSCTKCLAIYRSPCSSVLEVLNDAGMLQVENDQDTAALVYNYSVEVCTPENPYTSKRAVVRNVIWQHQEANPIGDQIDCHDDYSYQRWRCSTCGKTWKQIIS